MVEGIKWAALQVKICFNNHIEGSYCHGCTNPSIRVAPALGLRQWIEHENTMDDVVDIFI